MLHHDSNFITGFISGRQCTPTNLYSHGWTVLGFAWGSADEKKMQKSFGLGRQQLFGRFLDLQLVSQRLGYQQMGLSRLSETVLGCPNHKSKKVIPVISVQSDGLSWPPKGLSGLKKTK